MKEEDYIPVPGVVSVGNFARIFASSRGPTFPVKANRTVQPMVPF